jgi:hypothetical protein
MINLVRNAALVFLLGLALAGTGAAAPALAENTAVRNETLAAKEPAMRAGFDEPKPAAIGEGLRSDAARRCDPGGRRHRRRS